jgi:predicted nucleic acid-binding protein
VLALLNRRDEYHVRANQLSGLFGKGEFLVTDAVLMEIGNGLARHYRRQAVEIIEDFEASDDVEVVRTTYERFIAGLELYKHHDDKTWGLVDCLSFNAMREAGIEEALTADEHFVQAGFRALMLE